MIPELGSATDAVAEALLLKQSQDRSRFPGDPTCGHYLGYLEDRPDQVVGAVRSIARDEGAALVHCAAGKDRTGVVVALALTAAGVRPQAVVADYAATGERTEAILGRLRRSPTYARDIDSLPAEAHRARPETMAAFLEQMDSPLRRGRAVADRPWPRCRGTGPAASQAALSVTGLISQTICRLTWWATGSSQSPQVRNVTNLTGNGFPAAMGWIPPVCLG